MYKQVSKRLLSHPLFQYIIELFTNWNRHHVPMLAAALSFYTLFSLGPLLILIIFLFGILFKKGTIQDELIAIIQSITGQSGSNILTTLINNYNTIQGNPLLNTAGIIILLATAGTVFSHLQKSLNIIFDSENVQQKFIGRIIKMIFSFAMIAVLGFLLLVALVLQAFIAVFSKYIATIITIPPVLITTINIVISFIIMVILFAAIYKLLPNYQLSWTEVAFGAAITSLLFMVGQVLISIYLGKSMIGNAYGAAGSLVLLLLWVYYCSQIIFTGAEITRLHAERKRKIRE